MIKNKIYCLALICATATATSRIPVVEAVFPGLLGNRLFVFCVAKIVATELGFNLYCPPIWGFPDTYQYQYNTPSQQYPLEHIMGSGPSLQDLDISSIVSNKKPRNIKLQGFFQRYKYLKPYKDVIRKEWLQLDPSLMQQQNPDDIVLHIRTQYGALVLPFEYYEQALASTTYNRVFICVDEPTSPFLEKFKKYNPIIVSSRSINQLMSSNISWDEISKINMDDFAFICSFNKIIISESTYSWWAAFLSNAQEIYAPYCSNESTNTYGKIDEERYHYIVTHYGNF
jgi:hypothetical protein